MSGDCVTILDHVTRAIDSGERRRIQRLAVKIAHGDRRAWGNSDCSTDRDHPAIREALRRWWADPEMPGSWRAALLTRVAPVWVHDLAIAAACKATMPVSPLPSEFADLRAARLRRVAAWASPDVGHAVGASDALFMAFGKARVRFMDRAKSIAAEHRFSMNIHLCELIGQLVVFLDGWPISEALHALFGDLRDLVGKDAVTRSKPYLARVDVAADVLRSANG